MKIKQKLSLLSKNIHEAFGCKVWYQPPNETSLKYPCVVLYITSSEKLFADNLVHNRREFFRFQYISKNPIGLETEDIQSKVDDLLPTARLISVDILSNLYHYTYEIII